jgi:hypothetical protein
MVLPKPVLPVSPRRHASSRISRHKPIKDHHIGLIEDGPSASADQDHRGRADSVNMARFRICVHVVVQQASSARSTAPSSGDCGPALK